MISFGGYCKFYFLDYPKYSARWWQYGMKEAIASVEESRYRCVIVSDRAFFHPPYIFVLFYTQYPPSDYQRLPLNARQNLWRYTEQPLDRYYTLNVPDFVLGRGTCLLLIQPDEMPEIVKKGNDWREVHAIRDPLGKEVIKLVEIRGMKGK